MRRLIILITIAVGVSFIGACSNSADNSKATSEIQSKNSEVYYTCRMHTEVNSNKPGNCPKCGMELVKKEASTCNSKHMNDSTDSNKCCK